MIKEERIALLSHWCQNNGTEKSNVEKVFEMISDDHHGRSNDPMQYPEWYIGDPSAKGWHDSTHYQWTQLLKEHFAEIRKEAIAVFAERKNAVHPDNDTLVTQGNWNTYFFYKNGQRYDEHLARCPLTSKVLKQIEGVDIAGRTYFSEMTAHTHISKHCGPHNFKLRTQLALVAPQGSKMIITKEPKQWMEGECFVFDDSFEHEAINDSDQSRIVLIVDVWNQSLTQPERMALEYVMKEFYHRQNS
jgi:aspartate beta-hydroxylase